MRDEILNAGLLGLLDSEGPKVEESTQPEVRVLPPVRVWNPNDFAREQILGLVRQVFLSTPPVRQVVFTGVEPETGVHHICHYVAEALACEAMGDVAILSRHSRTFVDGSIELKAERQRANAVMPLRRVSAQLRDNLWLVPTLGGEDAIPSSSLHAYLGEMRREFDYSIVEAPPAGESNQAAAMAQFADGIILVLAAHHTRRVTARKIKDTLEASRVRILGTVLSDRMFPIPDKLYRRL